MLGVLLLACEGGVIMAAREWERYVVFKNGVVVVTGTASQCARATGLQPRTIQAYASDPRRVSKWYVMHQPKEGGRCG